MGSEFDPFKKKWNVWKSTLKLYSRRKKEIIFSAPSFNPLKRSKKLLALSYYIINNVKRISAVKLPICVLE